MELILTAIATLLIAIVTSFFLFQTKKKSRKAVVTTTEIEDFDISDLEKRSGAIFFIGISEKSISVSADGVLRTIDFSRDLIKVLKKGMKAPRQGDSYIPQAVVFLNNTAGFEAQIKKIEEMGLDIGDIKTVQKRVLPENKGPIPFNSQPNRGCFACKQEIEKKASQCSACKAVIYCGAVCAKKDWPDHKVMCKAFKATIDHIQEWGLHDFPFEFYNKDKILANYNIVPLLSTQDKHNVGLFRRLCGCFSDLQWGEVGQQILMELQASRDPESVFAVLGLDQAMYPLSQPFPTDVNPSVDFC
jgi:hypothetical protein